MNLKSAISSSSSPCYRDDAAEIAAEEMEGKKSQAVSCLLEREKQSKTLLPKAERQIPLKTKHEPGIVFVTSAETGLIFLIPVHQEDGRVCKSSMSLGQRLLNCPGAAGMAGSSMGIPGIGERKLNYSPGDSLGCSMF